MRVYGENRGEAKAIGLPRQPTLKILKNRKKNNLHTWFPTKFREDNIPMATNLAPILPTTPTLRRIALKDGIMPFWKKVYESKFFGEQHLMNNSRLRSRNSGYSTVPGGLIFSMWTPRRKSATIHDARFSFCGRVSLRTLEHASLVETHLVGVMTLLPAIEGSSDWQFRRTPFNNVVGWEAVNTKTHQAFHYYDERDYELGVLVRLVSDVLTELDKISP